MNEKYVYIELPIIINNEICKESYLMIISNIGSKVYI